MQLPSQARLGRSAITVLERKPSSEGSCNSQTQGLEDVLMAAVEHGLSLIGKDFAQVTFYNLDTRYSLGKPEIPRKPERFIQALHDMFGDGAQIIEMFIKRAICREMGLNPNTLKRPGMPRCIKELLSRKEADDESLGKPSSSENRLDSRTNPTSSRVRQSQSMLRIQLAVGQRNRFLEKAQPDVCQKEADNI